MALKSALIVWGGWDGHTPDRSAEVMAEILERHGFAVKVENSTKAYADPAIHDLSLIVPMVTMATIEKAEVENLCAAVRGGVGLGGFHGLMCDSFRNEVEYQFMTGGQWVAHPGNIIDYRVNITKPNDPLVKGIGDFDYHSEQYYMHVDPANDQGCCDAGCVEEDPWQGPRVLFHSWTHSG
jgi:uncharacterized protein